MGSFSIWHWLIVLLVVVLVFGTKKLRNVGSDLGGAVKGGRVYGRWPGLAPEARHEGRDLAVTTDFRDVFAEIVVRHLGADAATAGRVFPGYAVNAAAFRGVL